MLLRIPQEQHCILPRAVASTAGSTRRQAEGGEGVTSGEAAFKRKYAKAKSAQERFNIAQEAKASGVSKDAIINW